MASYDPPDWVDRNKGVARTAFERAADLRKTENVASRQAEPAQPKPALKHEMKGPMGEAVRKQVANDRQAAVLRAQKLEADRKAAGQEKQATEKRAGAIYDAKKSQGTNPSDVKSAFAKAAQSQQHSQAAAAEQDRSRSIDRAQKLANEFNSVAKSKENER